MRRAIIFVLLAVLAGGMVSAWEVEDVNGTFVYWEEHMKSPRIHEVDYSWGKGLSITETSIEFDLGTKEVKMPGMGLHLIENAYKEGEDSVCVKIFSIGDEERKFPIIMKVTFIDTERMHITHDQRNRYRDRSYFPEEKWVWYRLSGPKGR